MRDIRRAVDLEVSDNEGALRSAARAIWDRPELPLEENFASTRLREMLKTAGFVVEEPVEGLSTAFTARYGEASPVIGIIGEFDAVPGLGFEAETQRTPIEEATAGHGCGHNLLGVGSAGAALGLRRLIADEIVDGSVIYFGCPAEELLIGKPQMVAEGSFKGANVALSWHPADITTPFARSTAALESVQFTFHGESAHAAAAPEKGRSALDGVQVFATGLEHLREHVPQGVQIHYVIPHGGAIPNTVPDKASLWCYVRAPTWDRVEKVSSRVSEAARGASRITGTSMNARIIAGTRPYRSNPPLADALWNEISAADTLSWSENDLGFAQDLQGTISRERIDTRVERLPETVREEIGGRVLADCPVAPFDADWNELGATDLGEVSHAIPTATCYVTTWPLGCGFHSWQAESASREIGLAGMEFASRVLAATGGAVLRDDSLRHEIEGAFCRREDSTIPSPIDRIDRPPRSLRSISPQFCE